MAAAHAGKPKLRLNWLAEGKDRAVAAWSSARMTCLPADSWSHRGVLGWQRAITGSELATVASASLPLQALLSQLHTTL